MKSLGGYDCGVLRRAASFWYTRSWHPLCEDFSIPMTLPTRDLRDASSCAILICYRGLGVTIRFSPTTFLLISKLAKLEDGEQID